MKKIKIGLAGLGTVGRGVYEILNKDAQLISMRCGASLEITAVSARGKKDFVDSKVKFYENALDLAADSGVDVVVEAIGGANGIAKELVEQAIKNNKKVVTANKALLAENGFSINQLVEENNGFIGFEAAVAGATPAIKTIKENLAANQIDEIHAILNGTSNFILTKMRNEALGFAEAIKQAQEFGYAEADPSSDILGVDSAHKLAILSAISSQTKPQFSETYVEGIDQITIDDIKFADDFGYKIKLLAIFKTNQQTVYPALIKKSEQIAQIDGALNGVLFNASNAGPTLIIGAGAGAIPTASAIVADLIDIARGNQTYLFGVKSENLAERSIAKISERVGQYFIRLNIVKEAAGEKFFADNIALVQAGFVDKGDEILCGFLTEKLKEIEVVQALENLNQNQVKFAKFIRVETTNF